MNIFFQIVLLKTLLHVILNGLTKNRYQNLKNKGYKYGQTLLRCQEIYLIKDDNKLSDPNT